MMLSTHFSLDELQSPRDPARPTPQALDNLQDLCNWVLEFVRKFRGKPVKINSGYRSPQYNASIGGAKASQHMEGRAADIPTASLSLMVYEAAYCTRIEVKSAEGTIHKPVGGIGLYPDSASHFYHVDTRPRVGGKIQNWIELGGKYISPIPEPWRSKMVAAGAKDLL